jgi:hypothetical protein
MILEFTKPSEKPSSEDEPMDEDEAVFNPIFGAMADEDLPEEMITVPIDDIKTFYKNRKAMVNKLP